MPVIPAGTRSVWARIWSVPLVVNPVMGAVVEAVHENVVPTTVEVRLTGVLV